jgi:phosphate transport system substrate-binding protein
MRLVSLAAPAAAGVLLLSACGSSDTSSSSSSASSSSSSGAAAATATCVQGSLSVSGSTALQPLAQNAAAAYMAKCPGATVTVSGGGSSTGLSNVDSGTSDIGMSDVPSCNAKNLKNQLTDNQVAIVIFAVVVNPKSGVTNLTTAQIQDIFSGKVTNFSAVGGASVPISVIERKPGSGTRLTFEKTVMKGVAETSTPASTQDSTSLVVAGVSAADGGISYINVASKDGLTAVSIDGASPTADHVKGGTYPFYAHEHMYVNPTNTANAALANDFINYIKSNEFQTTHVSSLGFVPVGTTTVQSAVDAC